MSGDCDLCGSYDHVETRCDAYDCRTCEDDGVIVSLDIDRAFIGLIRKPCPDCSEIR